MDGKDRLNFDPPAAGGTVRPVAQASPSSVAPTPSVSPSAAAREFRAGGRRQPRRPSGHIGPPDTRRRLPRARLLLRRPLLPLGSQGENGLSLANVLGGRIGEHARPGGVMRRAWPWAFLTDESTSCC